jgi:hypothetical protein
MRYRMGDATELTRLLLSVFMEVPRPAIAEGLHRYLWKHARFGYAEQLADASDDVQSGSAGHFLNITKRAASCLHTWNLAITSYSLRTYAPCIKQIFPASRRNGMCTSSTTRTRSESLPMTSCARAMGCFYRPSRIETTLPSDKPSHGNRWSDQPLAVSNEMSFDFCRHCHFRTGKRRKPAIVIERNVRKRPSYGRS